MDQNQSLSNLNEKIDEFEKVMYKQHASLKTEMQGMNSKVDKIYTSIVGDDGFGQIGLAKRVKDLEDKDDEWKATYQKGLGIMLVVGFLGTALMSLFLIWIENKFVK